MDLTKEDFERNGLSGLPSISSTENKCAFSRNLKASQSSDNLSLRSIQTNKIQRVSMFALKDERMVKTNWEVPTICQLGHSSNGSSSKSRQNRNNAVLNKTFMQPTNYNKKYTNTVPLNFRNPKIAQANINESMKFMVTSKMEVKNTEGNNLGQKSMSLKRSKMASTKNGKNTRPEKTEDSRHSQEHKPSLKISALDKQCSVRNTIKQFRKWYFEQQGDNLEMTINTQNSQQEIVDTNIHNTESVLKLDFVNILERKIAQGRNVETNKLRKDSYYSKTRKCEIVRNGDLIRGKNLTLQRNSKTGQLSPVRSALWSSRKEYEEYNKMSEYMEENRLDNLDREQWVQVWVADVQTTMEETGRELYQAFE